MEHHDATHRVVHHLRVVARARASDDDARGVIVMFGGEAEQTIPTLGDTWEWNGSQWKQVLGAIHRVPASSVR
jgi:hypothetical protein